MSPKDKAIELYNKFYRIPLYVKNLKEACHITIDEILQADMFMMTEEQEKFWEDVKKEVDTL